jgi:hypothetical protein
MLLLYFNVISCNLTLLNFFENLKYVCYQTIYVVVFLRVLAAGSSLGGKVRTR